jgi:hypothetical protein
VGSELSLGDPGIFGQGGISRNFSNLLKMIYHGSANSCVERGIGWEGRYWKGILEWFLAVYGMEEK